MSSYGIGVYATAKIITRSGREYSLWEADRPFLQSVSVEQNQGDLGVISAVMSMPMKDGLELLADRNIIVQGNRLQVKMGYSGAGGASTPWFDGLMRSPGIEISPSGVTINLSADAGHVVAFSRAPDRTYRGHPFNLLKDIGADYGWDVVIDPGGPPLTDEVISLAPGAGSTWAQLWTLFRDRGYVLTGDMIRSDGGRSLVRLSPVVRGERTAVRTFVMFGSIDASKSQYPILGFSADSSPMYLWQGAAGITHNYIDEDGKEVVVEATPAVSDDRATGDSIMAPPGQETKVGGALVDLATGADAKSTAKPMQRPTTLGPDASTAGQVQAQMDERAEVAGYTIDISTVGIPDIFGNDEHLVLGVGLYDGYYTVKSFSMKVDASGFTCDWKGLKKTIDGLSGFMRVPKAVDDTRTRAGT